MENYKESIQLVLDLHPEYNTFEDIKKVVKNILPYERVSPYLYGLSFKVSDKILDQFAEPTVFMCKYSLHVDNSEVVIEDINARKRFEYKNRMNSILSEAIKDKDSKYLKYTYAQDYGSDGKYDWNLGWKAVINNIYGVKAMDTDSIYINVEDDDNV